MYQFISIGGWCGPRMTLDVLKIINEPHNVFDHIRSSSKGIIDCIKTDFANFLPTNLVPDYRYKVIGPRPYFSEHFGFFHSGDLSKEEHLESLRRKMERFDEHCKSNKQILFIRANALPDYNEELDDMKEICMELEKKYPGLNYKIVFIIADQDTTEYYKDIDNKILIFTITGDSSVTIPVRNREYKKIYDILLSKNIFDEKLTENYNLTIKQTSNYLAVVANMPSLPYYKDKY